MPIMTPSTAACAAPALLAAVRVAVADLPEEERWNARFQATYVWQAKPSFDAPYTGPHSLLPSRKRAIRSPARWHWAPGPGPVASCTSIRRSRKPQRRRYRERGVHGNRPIALGRGLRQWRPKTLTKSCCHNVGNRPIAVMLKPFDIILGSWLTLNACLVAMTLAVITTHSACSAAQEAPFGFDWGDPSTSLPDPS